AVEVRVGKRRQDAILSSFAGKEIFREGRWRTFGNAMSKSFVANSLKFTAAVMVSSAYNGWGRKMIDSMDMRPEDRMNMYAMMKEVWWLMAIGSLSMILANMAKGDDDDDEYKDKIGPDGKMKRVRRYKKNVVIDPITGKPEESDDQSFINYV